MKTDKPSKPSAVYLKLINKSFAFKLIGYYNKFYMVVAVQNMWPFWVRYMGIFKIKHCNYVQSLLHHSSQSDCSFLVSDQGNALIGCCGLMDIAFTEVYVTSSAVLVCLWLI